MNNETSKVYTRAEILELSGFSYATIIKFEKLGIIPVKTMPKSNKKVYFKEGLERVLLLKYLIENLNLRTLEIRILIDVFTTFNIDMANIKVIGDRIVSQENQEKNISVKKQKIANIKKTLQSR